MRPLKTSISIMGAVCMLATAPVALAQESDGDLAAKARDPTQPLTAFQIRYDFISDFHLLPDADQQQLVLQPIVPWKWGDQLHIARFTLAYVTNAPDWGLLAGLLLATPLAALVAVRGWRRGGDRSVDPALVAVALGALAAPFVAVRFLWLAFLPLLLLSASVGPSLTTASPTARRRAAWSLAAAALAPAALAEPVRVALLPVIVHSADSNSGYLSAGLADMLAARLDVIAATDRVVVVSTAHGLKFTGSKAAYHAGELHDIGARFANPPVELPADSDRVIEALTQRFEL